MDRWILCVALFVPVLASAFEPGDAVVCIRSCEFSDSQGCTCYLPGMETTVSAVKRDEVQSRSFGGWLPADCVIAAADAKTHFERRLKDNPNDAEARCGLAVMLLASDKNESLAQVNEAVRRKESWITLHRKAYVHWSRDETDEAQAALARAIKIEPDEPQLYVWSGIVSMKKDPQRALAAFNRCLALDSRNISALHYRAMIYSVDLKDSEKALADLDTALRLRPTAVACLTMRAGLLLQLNKPNRTLDDCEAILKIDSQCGDAYRYRGMAFLTKGDASQAIEAFSQVLKIDPGTPSKHANTLMARSACFLTQKQWDDALRDCSDAIRLDPLNGNYYGNRAAIWNHKDDWEQSFADLNEAIRLDPKSSTWVANRGAAYFEVCEYKNALVDLDKSLLMDPKQIRARCRLVLIYAACPDESLRDAKKAEDILLVLKRDEDFKRDKDPDNAMLMMQATAAVCAETGRFEEALELQRIEVGMTVIKNDQQGEREARERLALYEAGKPYRLPTKKR